MDEVNFIKITTGLLIAGFVFGNNFVRYILSMLISVVCGWAGIIALSEQSYPAATAYGVWTLVGIAASAMVVNKVDL